MNAWPARGLGMLSSYNPLPITYLNFIFCVFRETFAPSASGSLNPDESGLPDAEGKQKLRRDRGTCKTFKFYFLRFLRNLCALCVR